MAEDRRRALERGAAQGDLESAARLLLELVRAGELARSRVELLARCGDPRACLALGQPRPVALETDPGLRAFRSALAAAVVWTQERPQRPRGAMRSAALRPPLAQPPWVPSMQERREEVERLVRAREARLRATGGWPDVAEAYELAGGRLLLYAPDDTLAGGSAEGASEGLLGPYNRPGWDGWLHYAVDGIPPGSWRSFRSYLVCYVPPSLLVAAEAGVRAQAGECLAWADDMDLPFARRLWDAGLTC